MALLYKLEKMTVELAGLSRQILALTHEFQQQWLPKLTYTKEEKEELQEAGCSFGTGDRAMQKVNLDRYEARLVQRIAELQKGLPERKRLCQSLGIMGGLFLFLILV